jgi:hypothetical protein
VLEAQQAAHGPLALLWGPTSGPHDTLIAIQATPSVIAIQTTPAVTAVCASPTALQLSTGTLPTLAQATTVTATLLRSVLGPQTMQATALHISSWDKGGGVGGIHVRQE